MIYERAFIIQRSVKTLFVEKRVRSTTWFESTSGNWKPLKNNEKRYLFHLKSLFLGFSNFSPDFFSPVVKWVDKKTKFNFKIYDVINWETNNYLFPNSYILRNFTRSKVSETMKYVQFNKRNVRSIFLKIIRTM